MIVDDHRSKNLVIFTWSSWTSNILFRSFAQGLARSLFERLSTSDVGLPKADALRFWANSFADSIGPWRGWTRSHVWKPAPSFFLSNGFREQTDFKLAQQTSWHLHTLEPVICPWAFLLHFQRLTWMKPPKTIQNLRQNPTCWSSIGAMVKKKRPAESATGGLEDLLGDGPEEQEFSVSQRLGWTSFFVKTLLKPWNGTEFLHNSGLKSQPSGSMPRRSMRRWTRSRRHELPRFWAARRDAIVLNIWIIWICIYIYIYYIWFFSLPL